MKDLYEQADMQIIRLRGRDILTTSFDQLGSSYPDAEDDNDTPLNGN